LRGINTTFQVVLSLLQAVASSGENKSFHTFNSQKVKFISEISYLGAIYISRVARLGSTRSKTPCLFCGEDGAFLFAIHEKAYRALSPGGLFLFVC
jgi:hypothetical protein